MPTARWKRRPNVARSVARAALAAADRAKAAVRSLSGLLSGQLTVGAFEGASERLLAAALSQFRQAHPAVEVRAKEDYAAELLSAVRRGELDAAITGLPDTARPPSGVTVTELASEPLVVAASLDHPLAREAKIPITRPRLGVRIVLASGEATPSPAARAFIGIVTLAQANRQAS